MQTKVCSICSLDLPVSEFHKNPGGKFGVRADCISCFKKRRHNGEVVTDLDRKRQKSRERYAANPEPHLKRSADWQKANPERVNAAAARYRKSHPEKVSAYLKEYLPIWHANNPGKAVEYTENRRARKLSAEGSFTSEDVVRLYEAQNGA